MAHTAAAATVYPILLGVYALYDTAESHTRFGKALFIGMAFAAGAGSIVTFFGSARAPVAAELFYRLSGGEIELARMMRFLTPVGWLMVLLIWAVLLALFRPEKSRIAGLSEKMRILVRQLGPLTRDEKIVLFCSAAGLALMLLHPAVPFLRTLDRTAVMMGLAVSFFLFGVLTVKELEEVPWNMLLLFGGALSLSLCLWRTGAAQWWAVKLLPWLGGLGAPMALLAIALGVLLATNVVMNVVAVSVAIPVALALAPYLGVAEEAVVFASLAAGGMPFMVVFGTAPNLIAHGSGKFGHGDFLRAGFLVSAVALVVIGLGVLLLWPYQGMQISTR
jgi:sodium-dependent dicarboxylate transporter 2/3/5